MAPDPARSRPAVRTFGLGPVLALLLAFFFAAMASGCALSQKGRLGSDLGVGSFSGPAGTELAAALIGRGGQGRASGRPRVLSGATEFSYRVDRSVETAMTKGAGPDGGKAPVSFDAAVTEASLTAEWTVSDRETGAVIRAGRTTDVLKRSSGGWLAAQGAAPGDPPSEDEAKRILAEALSGQMVAELGPALSASGLERAGDPQSRKALALAAAGHWEEAAELWREVIALNPDHAAAHYNLGLHHERLGELDEAWASYRLAFLCLGAPIHREALTRLTDALNRQGRPPRPSGSALGGEGTWR